MSKRRKTIEQLLVDIKKLQSEKSSKEFKRKNLEYRHSYDNRNRTDGEVRDAKRELEKELISIEKKIPELEKELAKQVLAEKKELAPSLIEKSSLYAPWMQKLSETNKAFKEGEILWTQYARELREIETQPSMAFGFEDEMRIVSGAATKENIARQKVVDTYQKLEAIKEEQKALVKEVEKVHREIKQEYASIIADDVNEITNMLNRICDLAYKIKKVSEHANNILYANSGNVLGPYHYHHPSVFNPVELKAAEEMLARLNKFEYPEPPAKKR